MSVDLFSHLDPGYVGDKSSLLLIRLVSGTDLNDYRKVGVRHGDGCQLGTATDHQALVLCSEIGELGEPGQRQVHHGKLDEHLVGMRRGTER
jgi:hypothetical protein